MAHTKFHSAPGCLFNLFYYPSFLWLSPILSLKVAFLPKDLYPGCLFPLTEMLSPCVQEALLFPSYRLYPKTPSLERNFQIRQHWLITSDTVHAPVHILVSVSLQEHIWHYNPYSFVLNCLSLMQIQWERCSLLIFYSCRALYRCSTNICGWMNDFLIGRGQLNCPKNNKLEMEDPEFIFNLVSIK
jgi:hypothetical protein